MSSKTAYKDTAITIHSYVYKHQPWNKSWRLTYDREEDEQTQLLFEHCESALLTNGQSSIHDSKRGRTLITSILRAHGFKTIIFDRELS
jgi:hypothetical protein